MTETVAGQELGVSFQGTTIRPEDRDYDAARAIYNGSIDRRPALVVRPRCAADVADAVAYARDTGLPLSVRCGGHGVAGTSVVDGGVLIDLSIDEGRAGRPGPRNGDRTGGHPVGRVRPGRRSCSASPPRVAA